MTKKPKGPAPPDGITSEHCEGPRGWRRHASVLPVLVLGAIVAWGASGYAGSRNERHVVAAEAVALAVTAPGLIRNGGVYESTIEVTARRRIGKLVLAVSPGLWHDTTINSMVPEPAEQTFEAGMVRLDFGKLEAGASFAFKVDLQINPALFGDNVGEVVVLDGAQRLAGVPLRIRVLP